MHRLKVKDLSQIEISGFSKNRNMIKFIIPILCCILWGCSGNSIHYEPAEKVIRSCSNSDLRYILIDSDNGSYIYKIKNHHYSKSFSLSRPDTNFKVSTYSNSNFRLRPNQKYLIQNGSNGDAAMGKLTLRTDGKGEVVVNDSITNCPD
jgi:hypothetical protein